MSALYASIVGGLIVALQALTLQNLSALQHAVTETTARVNALSERVARLGG